MFFRRGKFNPIWICGVNHGYARAGYPLNLWLSLERIKLLDFPLRFYAFDEAANGILVSKDLPTERFLLQKIASHAEAVRFGKEGWGKVTGAKLELIHRCLKLGQDVVLIDADIVFRRDPRAFLQSFMESRDLAFQVDGPAWIWEQDKLMRNCCTGLVAIRSTKATCRLFDPSIGFHHELEDDQDFIKRRLREEEWNVDSIGFLPREYFPNGAFYYQFASEIDDRTLMLHFNHVVGNKKIDKMKDYGCWFCEKQNDV